MRAIPVLVATSVAAMSCLGLIQSTAVASSVSTRNGGYVEASRNPSTVVEFVVGDHGSRITEAGITCAPNAALVAQGAPTGAEQFVPIPQPLPGRISSGGSFSYSAMVTLTPDDTQSAVSVSSQVVLTIHFLHLTKVIVNKTIAATGTVFVPSVCPGTSPLHFPLKWDPSARL
jgi:hypothetical protein